MAIKTLDDINTQLSTGGSAVEVERDLIKDIVDSFVHQDDAGGGGGGSSYSADVTDYDLLQTEVFSGSTWTADLVFPTTHSRFLIVCEMDDIVFADCAAESNTARIQLIHGGDLGSPFMDYVSLYAYDPATDPYLKLQVVMMPITITNVGSSRGKIIGPGFGLRISMNNGVAEAYALDSVFDAAERFISDAERELSISVVDNLTDEVLTSVLNNGKTLTVKLYGIA